MRTVNKTTSNKESRPMATQDIVASWGPIGPFGSRARR
jgi:hypothetical protein